MTVGDVAITDDVRVVVPGQEVVDAECVMSVSVETVVEMAPDEAGGSGDEDAHYATDAIA